MAVEHGLVPKNVAKAAHPPRIERREYQTWSAEQCRRFLAVAITGSAYGPIWALALATGVRRGELLGVRWRDVDLKRGTLSVRQAIVSVNGRTTVSPHPKTSSSRRTIPLTPRVVAELQSHRARQLERRLRLGDVWSDYDLVFASEVGTPISPRNLIREFVGLVARAGVKRVRIHDLRHTYATIALGTGAPVREVADILGHSSPATTLRIYGHAIPGRGARLVSAVEDIIHDGEDDDEGDEDENEAISTGS